MESSRRRISWSSKARFGVAIAGMLCAGGLAFATASAPSLLPKNKIRRSDPMIPSTSSIAPQVALDSRSLAAADVSAADAAAIEATITAHLTNGWTTFQVLLSQRDAAKIRASRPANDMQNGEHTQASLAQDASAAQAAVTVWLAAVREAAIADVPAEQTAKLNRLYANRGSALPPEFRILALDQPQIVKLRDALTQRARDTALAEQTSTDITDTIAAFEDASVLAARGRIELLSNP